MQLLNDELHDLEAAVMDRLGDLGLHAEVTEEAAAHGGGARLLLSRGTSVQEYALALTRTGTLSALGSAVTTSSGAHPRLVAAEFVSPRSADAFRRAGLQYVDRAGNAWVEFDDVLIDIRGRPSAKDPAQRARGLGGNLFSNARAQVVFALLAWPRMWKAPQRDVAHAAGVSVGQANNALSMLKEAGFGPAGHRQHSELLDLWAAAFPSGLARKITLASYRGPVQNGDTPDVPADFVAEEAAVSGEVAVSGLLRPASLLIYVEHLDPRLPIRNRWRSDGRPNITVRHKFWTTPPREKRASEEQIGGLRLAPDPLVYADLLASDDPRVRGAAPEWRGRAARPQSNF